MSTEGELREKRDIDYKKLYNGTMFVADKDLTPVKTTRVVTCRNGEKIEKKEAKMESICQAIQIRIWMSKKMFR